LKNKKKKDYDKTCSHKDIASLCLVFAPKNNQSKLTLEIRQRGEKL